MKTSPKQTVSESKITVFNGSLLKNKRKPLLIGQLKPIPSQKSHGVCAAAGCHTHYATGTKSDYKFDEGD